MTAGSLGGSVSVIVPTMDRPRQLVECLDGLARQSVGPRAFETIVVDDGGSIELEGELRAFTERLDLKIVRRSNGGPAAARNTGLENASGAWVAFTDDDCRPEETWLEALCGVLEDAGRPALIGGSIFNALPENSYSAASQLVLDLVYDHYNQEPSEARFLVTMNLLAPRRTLVDLGGFDSTFRTAEDRELCDRWLAAGNRMIYRPEARVGHAHCLDLSSFCRQHFGYGRGADQYHRLRAERHSGSLMTESRFHLELPRLLARQTSSLGVGRILSLTPHLVAWQLFNGAGFLWAKASPGDRSG